MKCAPWAGALALMACLLPATTPAQVANATQSDSGVVRTPAKTAVVNFTELARQAALRGPVPRAPRAVHPPMRRMPGSGTTANNLLGLASEPAQSASAAQGSSGSAPILGSTFPGLPDNQTTIPPDTDGAVGPNHVMVALNSQIAIQSRDGQTLSLVDFVDFWASLGHTFLSDPHLRFDHFSNRWIFVCIADPFSESSSVLVGYSQTSDPTGNWILFDIIADPQGVFWADYPLVGFNAKWLVVTVNGFDNNSGAFTGAGIYVFNRTNLVAGTTFKFFSDPSMTFAPAVTFGASDPNLYLVTDEDDHSVRVASISGALGKETFNRKLGLALSPDKWDMDEDNEDILPQLGSDVKIEANDSRILDCVFRDGSIWCVHHIYLPAGGSPNRTTVQFWQVATNGTVVQRARMDDPTGVNSYAYPSLAVNANDDVLIGYSRFSADQFPSANYTWRFSSDPPGALGDDIVLKDGEASYAKDFGSGRHRWGDYSGTCVDPVNGIDMWTLQEYAASPDALGDRWGTWWGQLFFGGVPDGILEVNVTPPTGTTLLAGTTNVIFVRVTDALAVTNATVVGTINGATNLVFTNDGKPPDQLANDATYSASLLASSNISTLNLTLNITAPGKTNNTTEIFYTVVPPPLNDNFTNATKVPPDGAVFLANNKFATTELREPRHAGIGTEGASLWWKWSPSTDTNVLIDTSGSSFKTVIAVYTGQTLATLVPVVSAAQAGTQGKGYLTFDAQSGATYQIAIASVATNSTGTLRLRVAPGGQPDTTAPSVAFTSPSSGVVLNTNQVTILGRAFDPQPNASGVKQVFVQVNQQPAVLAFGTEVWTNTSTLKKGFNTITATATDQAGNLSAPVTITVSYQVLDPVNDFFANAVGLAGNAGMVTGNNTNATKEIGEPNHAGNAGGKSVWWRFYAPSDGVLFLSTTNSSFDTLLGLYTGTRVNLLTTIASNDDAYEGSGFSKIAQAVTGNEVYAIAVDGYGGAFGAINLQYAFTPSTVYSLTVSSTAGGSVTPGSSLRQQGEPVTLMATPDPFYDFDHWDGTITSTDNPLSIVMNTNVTLTAHFRLHAFSDDFEAGGLANLPWLTSGNLPWLVQTNVAFMGRFAARAGAIGNSQASSLTLTGNFYNATASFVYKVSSEAGWDFLNFYLDGNLVQRWSGEVDWTTYQFPVPAGPHVLTWSYVKDNQNSAGLDSAFLDNVDLPLVQATNSFTPATLSFLGFLQQRPQIRVQGQVNQQYVIQSSTDLATWTAVSTNIATNGEILFTDSTRIGRPVRFYRAVVPQN
ncbi:MAG: InlB B-repeat-containing protein [Limisphaerales bacterium]